MIVNNIWMERVIGDCREWFLIVESAFVTWTAFSAFWEVIRCSECQTFNDEILLGQPPVALNKLGWCFDCSLETVASPSPVVEAIEEAEWPESKSESTEFF